MFSEWDEQTVDLYPVPGRQLGGQGSHSLFGCARFDIAPSVSDAMNVNIDADLRLPAGYAQDQVGAFRADAL